MLFSVLHKGTVAPGSTYITYTLTQRQTGILKIIRRMTIIVRELSLIFANL